MTAPPPKNFWSHRALVPVLVLLHAAWLMGVCQLPVTDAMREHVFSKPPGLERIGAAWQTGGALCVLRLYLDVHNEEKLYHRYAEVLRHGRDGKLPTGDPAQGRLQLYRDVPAEYQPGLLLFLLPPSLAGADYGSYLAAFIIWSGLVYLAAVWLAARALGDGTREQTARIWAWSLAFVVAFGPLLTARIDHAVALLCAAAWLAVFRAERTDSVLAWAAAGALIAAGVLTKIVPGVVLPAVLLWLVVLAARPRWRDAAALLAGFAVALLALHGAAWAWWGDGYLRSYTYHVERGAQIESTWAGVILAAGGLGAPVAVEHSYGSFNLATSHNTWVRPLAPWAFLTLAALVAWRSRAARAAAPLARALPMLTVVLLLAFVLTNKVFSPQYFLWLGPLVAALAGTRRLPAPVAWLFLAAAVLTQVIFPLNYQGLLDRSPWMVAVLNARNLLLAVLLGWLACRLPRLLRAPQ